MPRLAGRVQGVVVQMTIEASSKVGKMPTLLERGNFTKMAGLSLSWYSTSASARAVWAP